MARTVRSSTTIEPSLGLRPARSLPGPRWLSTWLLPCLLVAGAYWLGARAGLSLALVKNQVTPLWPPTGIALAALWWTRGRAWPGVLAGAFLVNAPLGPTLGAAGVIAVGNTLAPLVAYRLLLRLGFRADMGRFRDAMMLVAGASMTAMTVSATVGAASLVLWGPVPPGSFFTIWWVWWTGDAMGVLVVAPLLLMLSQPRLWKSQVRGRAVEAALVVITAAGLTIAVFGNLPGQPLFAVFPVLVWAALRFQLAGAAPVACIVTVIATSFAAAATGPFAGVGVLDRMARLQVFNACVAITCYLLAALTAERVAARAALVAAGVELEGRVADRTAELSARTAELSSMVDRLERSEHRAEQAQALAHIGSWDWDIAANQVTWSDELFRLFGMQPRPGAMTYPDYLDVLHPEDRDRVHAAVEAAYGSGEALMVEHRVVHPDGAVHWILGRGHVLRDGQGTPVRMVGTAQDMDERRAAEQVAAKLREVAGRRQQALELNDQVAQGLSVASFALTLGQVEVARTAVAGTLDTVQGMVSALWGEHAEGSQPSAGDLRREVPAQVSPARERLTSTAPTTAVGPDDQR